MAMTWKLLKQLRPPHTASSSLQCHRFLNFQNATRLFSDAPPSSVEPPSIPPPQNPHSPSTSSLNQTELAKFAAIAGTWWDSEGPFKPLHALNPTRLAFIRSTLRMAILTKGTHQWSSFLTPEELVLILERVTISVQEMAGFAYNPLTGRWSLSDDISVNFITYATKRETSTS